MNIASVISYIAASSLANVIALGNTCATIVFPVGAFIFLFKKDKPYKILISCICLILSMSFFSYLAFKEVITSFVDIENFGLVTFNSPIRTVLDNVKASMMMLLSIVGEASFYVIILALLLRQRKFALKFFFFGFLSSFIVAFILKGKIFVILSTVIGGIS